VFALENTDIQLARLTIEEVWSGSEWVEFPAESEAGYVVTFDTTALPPFMVLRYWWDGTRDNMTPFWTEPDFTEVTDTSQDWQKLEGTYADVFWYDRPQDYGQRALMDAEAQLTRLVTRFGEPIPTKARVVIYQRQDDYGTSGLRSGEAQARYGVTVQWPCQYDEEYLFNVTIPHEITHLWLWPYRFYIPAWFAEGFAVWSEPHNHAEQVTLLKRMGPRDELYEWRALQYRTYSNAETMQRWYAQAYGMVAYIDQAGDLGALFAQLRQENADFEYAVRAATDGLNSAQVLAAFSETIGAPKRESTSRTTGTVIDPGEVTVKVDWLLVGVTLLTLIALQITRLQMRRDAQRSKK